MPRLVQLRTDTRVRDDAQLLVRFNDDADVANAPRLALADAHRYRVLPGYAEHGAVTVSVFLVTGTTEARTLTAGIGQHLFGLTDAATARAGGSTWSQRPSSKTANPCRSPTGTPTSSWRDIWPVSCPTAN